jgi:predicted RNase H-like HicB family nuclease
LTKTLPPNPSTSRQATPLALPAKKAKMVSVNLTIKLHDCSVDGETGFAAVCAEFPEANGQGETREQCLADLRASIDDILSYRREEAQKSVVRGEKLETIPA